jgi:Skp family chaperone for outer membrane proteins
MKAIKSLLIIVMLFIGTISFAQSHNTATGSNCKYAKNRCTNMEGCPQCAACNINDKKEKDAKAEEIKKRNEKIWADAKAKKDAEQKAYQDKIDKEAADKKRKNEQDLADKKASDDLRKRYNEIANKGIVKSDVKGAVSTVELKNIEEFTDKDRKIYGFKLEGKEVAVFPFIEDYNYINRIDKTNYFEVSVFKNIKEYSKENYRYSIIIDHLGINFKIEEFYQFVRTENDENNSVLYLYAPLNSKEYINEIVTLGRSFNNFYDNRESAIAKIDKGWTELGFSTKFYIQNVRRYTVDYNLKILKKDIGWIIN